MAAAKEASSSFTMDSLYIKDTVDLLIARKDEISIRFSVEVRIERSEEMDQEDGCWVNILGDEDRVVLAKAYVKCLCAPEDIGSVQYPGDLHSQLSEKKNVFELEKKYKAVVEFNDGVRAEDPGEAIIRGDALSVALALSAIEERIATFLDSQRAASGGDTTHDPDHSQSHMYSDETSNKLNKSLMGISSKISLESGDVSKYPDVMKKLILSWANDDVDDNEQGEATIDLEDEDEDDEEDFDHTIIQSSRPHAPITSTPVVPQFKSSSSGSAPVLTQPRSSNDITIEKLPSFPPQKEEPSTKPKGVNAGRIFVDLTTSPGVSREVHTIDSDTSSDEEMAILRHTTKPVTTVSKMGVPSKMSPTSLAQHNISTITLDDTESFLDKPTMPVLSADEMTKLVALGVDKGYDEMEIGQALSLYDGGDMTEERFFSLLEQVRQGSDRSTPTSHQDEVDQYTPSTSGQAGGKAKKKKKKKKRNTALDSINKRQQSPSPKRPMSSEKRARTLPEFPERDNGVSITRVAVAPTQHIPAQTPPHHQQLRENMQRQQAEIERQQKEYIDRKMEEMRRQQQINHQASSSNNPSGYSNTLPPPLPRTEYTTNIPYPLPISIPPPMSQPPLPPTAPTLPPLPMAPALPMRRAASCRMVVIDGSNIAIHHGKKYYTGSNDKIFSAEGIYIAITYLRQKYGATSDTLKAIVPKYRSRDRFTRDAHLLDQMEDSGYLVYSPCKTMPSGKKIVPYDDRFILDLAVATNGVVISNDKYADLIFEQQRKYADVINNRVIMFMFVGDTFMIPEDPMGRSGPTLEQLLRPAGSSRQESTYHQPYNYNNQQPQHAFVKPLSPRSYQQQHHQLGQTSSVAHNLKDNQYYHGNNRYSTLGILPVESTGGDDSTSSGRRKRNHSKETELSTHLLMLFPDQESKIQGLLQRHPYEQDINYFMEYM